MAEKKLKFSVVIPYYNMGAYVDDAIASVDAQTLGDTEILIVNDGSKEQDSLDKLKQIRADRPDINVIDQQNKKLPGARNTGIKNAKADFVACLDADDTWDPAYLETMYGYYQGDKEGKVAIATSSVQFFGERDDIWHVPDFDLPLMFITNPLQSSTSFRRSVWEEVGGYDETMHNGYEDWDFWMRIVSAGYRWKSTDQTLINYRSRGDSMIVDSDKQRYEHYEYLLSKNTDFIAKHVAEILVEGMKRYDDLHGRYNKALSGGILQKLFGKS